MPTELDEHLVARIVAELGGPPRYGTQAGALSAKKSGTPSRSLLLASALQFGSRPSHEENTQPSGFDPRGAALFEGIVESAYLVATADGHFDEEEQRVFQHIVLAACAGVLTREQVSALVGAFEERLHMQGRSVRMRSVIHAVSWCENSGEVIRIAALMAEASGGVSAEERAVLEELLTGLQLSPRILEEAIEEAHALRGQVKSR